MIKYLIGDATKPIIQPCIIAHVCNNIGAFGKGFVVPLAQKYPYVKIEFKKLVNPKLGDVQFVKCDNITIANMIAQDGIYNLNNKIPLRYNALEECLDKVHSFALINNLTIHMPKIGCGLAGGDWNIIERIINNKLFDIPTHVYTLERN